MNVDYRLLIENIKGTFVSKPLSGTLSGHAAGEPFDKHVYTEIKKQLPQNTFRQYEYLNDLYSKNAETIGIKARQALFDSPSVLFLLSRGKEATKKWSLENPFDEKQDDTADILVVKDGFYEVIDIKTRNLSKTAQAPNIISAFKLAQLCAIMLDNKEFDSLSINYFEIDWLLEDDKLICKDAHFVSLFKSIPEKLYINWAAAMQIQFHVCNLDQQFKGTIEDWATSYLKHFVTQVYRRSEYMVEKYAKPFEKYIN
jgi:type II restriction enzyme